MNRQLTYDELSALHRKLELLIYLREMSDIEVQKTTWRSSSNPSGSNKGFAYFHDLIVEDLSFAKDAAELAEWMYLTPSQTTA